MESSNDSNMPSRLLTPIDTDQLPINVQKMLPKGQTPILMIACNNQAEQKQIFSRLNQANYELLSEDPDYPHKKNLRSRTSYLNVVMPVNQQTSLDKKVLIIVSEKDLGKREEEINYAIKELINKANSLDQSLRLEKL